MLAYFIPLLMIEQRKARLFYIFGLLSLEGIKTSHQVAYNFISYCYTFNSFERAVYDRTKYK